MNLRNFIFEITTKDRFSLRWLFEGGLPRPLLRFFYRLSNPEIPDRKFYLPCFSPHLVEKSFLELHSLVSTKTIVAKESLWVIYALAKQSLNLEGDFFEAGVYKGGTAKFLHAMLKSKSEVTLHLFDTFEGMPVTDKHADLHKKGDFGDTSLKQVIEFVGQEQSIFHAGFIPDTFAGLDNLKFSFAHVDVDIRSSVLACCRFLYPRMVPGGVIIFDDYGYATCPGERQAVDEFFKDKPECPLVLNHGQAIIFKLP